MHAGKRKAPCIKVGDYERSILDLLGFLVAYDAAKNEEARGKVLTRAWRQLWATPQWFVDGLAELAGVSFDLDLCAEAATAKAPLWFGPGSPVMIHGPGEEIRPAVDAFEAMPWRYYLGGSHTAAWFNPPFLQMQRWVNGILGETCGRMWRAIGVSPSSTDRPWFGQLLRHHRTHMTTVEGERLRFEPPPGVKPSSPGGGVVVWSVGFDASPFGAVLTLAEVREAADRAQRRKLGRGVKA